MERDLAFTALAVALGLLDQAALDRLWAAPERRSGAGLRAAVVAELGLTSDEAAALSRVAEAWLSAARERIPATLAERVARTLGTSAEELGHTLLAEPSAGESTAAAVGATLPSRAAPVTAGPGLDDANVPVTPEAPGRYAFPGGRQSAEIGRGGIGRVLVGLDQHLGREIAIKELLPDPGPPGSSSAGGSRPSHPSSPAMMRFLREARVTGQLEHPSIVPVYEIGRRPDGTVYYTMKLVRGRTLAAALRACHTPAERLALLPHYLNLCHAIAYAHSRGVIHRDIKTDNVMLGEFGETMVLDWGLAKVRGARDLGEGDLAREARRIEEAEAGHTVNGAALGTPAYMSPEQAWGTLEAIDERSDVWSLGAVLHELLTGAPPFPSGNAWDVVRRVRKETVPPVRSHDPAIPPELASVCDKALQRNRDARYRSAGDLAAEIQAYLSGERVAAYTYSSWELLRRFVARNRALTAAGAALLVVLVVGSALVYRAYRGAEAARQGEAAERQRTEGARRREAVARVQAQDQARKAQLNLAAAYVYRAEVIEKRKLHHEARAYYAAALKVRDDTAARSGLYRDLTQPIRARLEHGVRIPMGLQRAVAFTADGSRLAAGLCLEPETERYCRRSRIEVRVRPTGRVVTRIEGAGDLGRSLAFTPDGRRLIGTHCAAAQGSLCPDTRIRTWEADTGRLVGDLPCPLALVNDLAVDARGRIAVAGCRSERTGPAQTCLQGDAVVYAGPADLTPRVLSGHRRPTTSVRFFPDGDRLATAGTDACARIWDLATGREVRALCEQGAEVYALAVSPDGRTLATGTDANDVLLWDVGTGARGAALQGHRDSVRQLAFVPEPRLLVSGGDDRSLLVWDLERREVATVLTGYPEPLTAVSVVAGGREVATASALGTVRIWSLRPGATVRRLEGHARWVRGLAVSPDGQVLTSASQDGVVIRWSSGTGDLLRRDAVPPATAFAVSASGRAGLVGGEAGEVARWDAASGASAILDGPRAHGGMVRGVAVSPDGTRGISASEDMTLAVWDLDRALRVRTHRPSPFKQYAVAVAPDGRTFASGGADEKVRFWSLSADGEQCTAWSTESPVRSLAYSGRGDRLAVGLDDGRVLLLHLGRGALDRTLSGTRKAVTSLAFSPDDRHLATTGGDRQVHLWDVATGVERHTLKGHRMYVWAVRFTPDGRHLLSASGDRTVRRWPVLPEVWERSADAHQRDALRDTGLRVKGFDLVPWLPPLPVR
jgi:WD40 repeat protein